MTRSLGLIVCLFAASMHAGAAESMDARIDRIERDLRPPISLEGGEHWTLAERMTHYGVPGLSFAIIENGRVVATRAHGLADRQTRQPMRTDTLMQAASISKAVTAFAAMRMVERGQLRLDSPVNASLTSWKIPETYATRARPVTLAHLLSHTGGLGVHGFLGYDSGKALPSIVQILDGQPPANSPAVRVEQAPGLGFRYSGGGYTIAQTVMSDVAGRSFPELMRREVLKPVGMRDSTFEYPLSARRMKRAAAGVLADGRDVPGKRKVHPESAAAGLWTTPADLARFAIDVQKAVQGESRLLGRDTTERMLRDPGPDHYALGFGIVHENGVAYFGHDGWNEGFSSHLLANREGNGVAIMINANQPALMQELRRAVAFEFGWPGYRTEKRVPMTAAQPADLPGRYPYNAEQFIRVNAAGDDLSFEYGGEEALFLTPVGDGRFVATTTGLSIELGRDAADVAQLSFVYPDGRRESHTRYRDNERSLRERVYADDASVVDDYRKLAASGDVVASEAYLNTQGYRLIGQKRYPAAVQVLALVTQLFPASGNAWDSLGEASLLAGDRAAARRHYEKALALDPTLNSATTALERIGAD